MIPLNEIEELEEIVSEMEELQGRRGAFNDALSLVARIGQLRRPAPGHESTDGPEIERVAPAA